VRMSNEGISFLEYEEGKKLKVYKDSSGYPTIGIGHKLTKPEIKTGKIFIIDSLVDYSNGITEQECHNLLRQDIRTAENSINESVSVLIDQEQFDALVSLVFNIGTTAFETSTLLKKINSNNFIDTPNEFRRWHFSKSKHVQALADRREREIELFLS